MATSGWWIASSTAKTIIGILERGMMMPEQASIVSGNVGVVALSRRVDGRNQHRPSNVVDDAAVLRYWGCSVGRKRASARPSIFSNSHIAFILIPAFRSYECLKIFSECVMSSLSRSSTQQTTWCLIFLRIQQQHQSVEESRDQRQHIADYLLAALIPLHRCIFDPVASF